MSTKEIPVNGKLEDAYGIVSAEKTDPTDYLYDGNARKPEDITICEQEVWRIIFRDRVFEFAPALTEGTLLTLDNIARVDYVKYPGDEEKKIPPYNINHWWRKVELILSDGSRRIDEVDGGLPPIKSLTAQEKALVEQIIAQNEVKPQMLTISQAAAYCHVDYKTIYNRLRKVNADGSPMIAGVIGTGRLTRIPQTSLAPYRKPERQPQKPKIKPHAPCKRKPSNKKH